MSQGIAGATPQIAAADPQRRPQGTVSKDLLDALAAAKLLREKQAAQNQLMLSMENDPQTVVAKNQGELEKRSLDEVARGVSGVLQNKQKNAQKRINALASGQRRGRPPQGLAGARMAQAAAQQGGPRRMAQGGIVGFQEGGGIDAQIATIRNSTTMSEEQKAAAIKQLYATEAQEQAKGLGGVRNFLNQNLNPVMLAGDLVGGVEYLQGGLSDLVASGANLMNMPSVGAGAAKYADARYAAGKDYIDKGLDRGVISKGYRALFGQPEEDVTASVATPETNANILKEETRMQQGQTGGLPSVDPTPTVAPEPEGESYTDRRSRFARAGAMGGISGFAEAMTDIEAAEAKEERANRELDLDEEKTRLQAEYQQSIVDAQSYNNAVKNLLKYNQELNTLIAQHPMVVDAKQIYATAVKKNKGVEEAARKYNAARKQAMEDIGQTVSGGSLLANIAALNTAIEGFRGGSATVDSSGFGELKITG